MHFSIFMTFLALTATMITAFPATLANPASLSSSFAAASHPLKCPKGSRLAKLVATLPEGKFCLYVASVDFILNEYCDDTSRRQTYCVNPKTGYIYSYIYPGHLMIQSVISGTDTTTGQKYRYQNVAMRFYKEVPDKKNVIVAYKTRAKTPKGFYMFFDPSLGFASMEKIGHSGSAVSIEYH